MTPELPPSPGWAVLGGLVRVNRGVTHSGEALTKSGDTEGRGALRTPASTAYSEISPRANALVTASVRSRTPSF